MQFDTSGLAAPVDEKKVCDSAANATTAVSLADLRSMRGSSRMNDLLASGGVRKQMFPGAKPKRGGLKRVPTDGRKATH